MNKGNHYRSDPVRVQSTPPPPFEIESCLYLPDDAGTAQKQEKVSSMRTEISCFQIVGHRADARSRGQKLCCGRPQKGLLGRYMTSECNELLNPTRASCLILAQRQPGKLSRGPFPPCVPYPGRQHRQCIIAITPSVGTESRKKFQLFALLRPYHGNL